MDIRVVTHADDIAACLRVRRIVFIEEQGVSEDEEIDGRDPESTHVLVRDGATPIAAARVRILDDVAKIERVCVLTAHRGNGLGAQVMKFILTEVAADPKVKKARLGAQIHALAFYQKLGFVPFGDTYLDAGIPHRDMEIDLKKQG